MGCFLFRLCSRECLLEWVAWGKVQSFTGFSGTLSLGHMGKPSVLKLIKMCKKAAAVLVRWARFLTIA